MQRRREADAAGERVVQVDARFVAEVLGHRRAAAHRAGLALRVVALPERQPHVAAVAHQQQRRHVLHREAQAHHAVALLVLRPGQRLHDRPRHAQPVAGRVHLLLRQVEFARADVLVRVELDLLEADDARRDVHVTVGGHGSLAAGRHVEHRDLRVRDGVGVVVAVDGAHVGLAALEVERLHLEEPPFHDVDRLRMQRGRAAVEVRLAEHLRSGRDVDHHEVVGRDRAQADRIRRVALAGPVPLPVFRRLRIARAVHESVLAQDVEHLLHVDDAERVGAAERQLERRALHVVDQDVQVVGIDQRVLGRGVEEVLGVLHHELIHRRGTGHHHRG